MASLQQKERPIVQRTPAQKLGSLKVLAVIDGSERTGCVIEYALRLAQDGRGVEVVLLGVVPEPPGGRLRGYESFKRNEVHARLKGIMHERAITTAARRFDRAGVAHEDRIEVGDPAGTILHVADEESCDIILLGAAPRGSFQRWLAKVTGLSVVTVASEVAQLAAVPVTVVK